MFRKWYFHSVSRRIFKFDFNETFINRMRVRFEPYLENRLNNHVKCHTTRLYNLETLPQGRTISIEQQ